MIDKLISYFSPVSGLKRLQYRRAISIIEKRKYEGASRTRRMSNWTPTGSSANTEISGALPVLRNRSRDLIRNNPYANRAQQVICSNLVGKGIIPKLNNASDALLELWSNWAETTAIDYDGALNFYGIQNLVAKSIFESGEVLIRRRTSTKDEFPFKLQVLEADHLASDFFKYETGNGNVIVMGIELNNKDIPVAYHLYQSHPGNVGTIGKFTDTYKINRIPAEEIIHIYRKDRPGQLRGVPWISPVMIRLRELDEFEDAMIVRQKVAACFSAFIHDIEAPTDIDSSREFDLEKLEPGVIEFLPPGKSITFGTPPLPPTGTYETFVKNLLQSIAAGLGISYEALTGNLSEVNYSSGRMGWLEFQRNLDSWRNLMIIPGFCEEVFNWFLMGAYLSGYDIKNVYSTWTPPRREMIDPTKEIPAKVTAIRSGIESFSDVIRQSGKDPDQHLIEVKQDFDNIKELGLILDCDPSNIEKPKL